jgi:hypothetical protein
MVSGSDGATSGDTFRVALLLLLLCMAPVHALEDNVHSFRMNLDNDLVFGLRCRFYESRFGLKSF